MMIREQDNLAIGMIGNLPEPYGGVSTTCYYLTRNMMKLGVRVCFYDRSYNPNKHLPEGLFDYYITSIHKARFLVFLTANIFKQLNNNPQMRVLLNEFFRIVQQNSQLRNRPKIVLTLLFKMVEIAQFFQDKPIHLLHGQHAGIESLISLLIAKYYLYIPFVVTVHASEFTMISNRRWLYIAQMVCREADAVMCNSYYTCQQMNASGVFPNIASVIHLGVNEEQFLPPELSDIDAVRNRFNLPVSVPIVLFTGWLIERKGPQILVAALSNLLHIQWQAILVGPDHGLKTSLEAQINGLNLEHRVTVSEAIPYAELMALYSISYVFIFPTLSKDEGFGLVALEAMAHGLPVIASKTGAIPEVILEDESGLFFTPGDHEELTRHLEQILLSKDLRNEMSTAAKIRARSFTWERSTRQLISLYNRAIKKHAGSV